MIESLLGFGPGYLAAINVTKAEEARQGKNFCLAAIFQSTQLTFLSPVMKKFASLVPGRFAYMPLVSNLLPLAAMPVFLFLAIVRQGDYTKFAKWWNSVDKLPGRLPEQLSQRTVKILSICADQIDRVMRVATVASGIALIALGSYWYGGALLGAVAYQTIDMKGFVPRKLSLFLEKTLQPTAFAGIALGGNLISRILMSTQVLPLIPALNHFVMRKVDLLVRNWFKMKGPTLQEINAPLVTKKYLTAKEIEEALNSPYSPYGTHFAFKINPAHCSKWVADLQKLPQNRQFGQFQSLFDRVPWANRYELVKRKMADDDRFIDFLAMKYPHVAKTEFSTHMDLYLGRLATVAKLSKEQYAASWLSQQMGELVRMLTGKKRPQGFQQDLADAMDNCARLLPHLQTLDPVKDQVEFEDTLLKLAVEGGDYCARGIKRTSSELIGALLQRDLAKAPAPSSDLMEDYESKIRRALQEQRFLIVQQYFDSICRLFLKQCPEAFQKDVHVFDLYRTYLSLGVIPITEHERNRLNLVLLYGWEMYNQVRERMYRDYDVEKAIQQIGEVHFGDYIRQFILTNPNLSEEDKGELLDKFTERNNGQWTVRETQERFHRLLFIKMGILQKKSEAEIADDEKILKEREMFEKWRLKSIPRRPNAVIAQRT
jgi:hypothetical protein